MFFLVDCNNFYASCEQVFQPHLQNKALVILSNNDGCVIARSKEAKKMGIKMGDPAFLHKDKQVLTMLSSNFTLYADFSERIIQILENFGFPMQVYSIDESFLFCDLKKTQLKSFAFTIKSIIKQWTGIEVSIGIGKTKTLAKLANKIAKNNTGVFLLEDKNLLKKIFSETLMQDIWGIGLQLSLRLKKKGIFSVADFIAQDAVQVQKILGINGLKTFLELKKVPCFSLNDNPEYKKSLSCIRSFSQKQKDKGKLIQALSTYIAIVTEKMRKQKLYAQTFSIYLATGNVSSSYYSQNILLTLPHFSHYTPDFLESAIQGFKTIYKPNIYYKRCGVILLDLQKTPAPLFFPDPKHYNKKRLIQTFDQINEKYGKNTVYFLAQGTMEKKIYKNKSPNFTTSWKQILSIDI